MVLWRTRRTIPLVQPGDSHTDASPQSGPTPHQSGPVSVPYAVHTVTLTGTQDPIAAVQSANTPDGTTKYVPRNAPLRSPGTHAGRNHKQQQRAQEPPVLRHSPSSVKVTRAGSAKTKRHVTVTTKVKAESNSDSVSQNATNRDALLSSRIRREEISDDGVPDSQLTWAWNGSLTSKPSALNFETKTPEMTRKKTNSPNFTRTRRKSIALPVTHPNQYENHPNLNENHPNLHEVHSCARPKSGSLAARRQNPRAGVSSRSWVTPTSPGESTCRELATKSPGSTSRCPSPQPSFASEYIAEIFQTSDRFLMSRPGSGRPGSSRPGSGRPGSGRPSSARPRPPRPASARPPSGKSGSYRARPASAFPTTRYAKNSALVDRNLHLKEDDTRQHLRVKLDNEMFQEEETKMSSGDSGKEVSQAKKNFTDEINETFSITDNRVSQARFSDSGTTPDSAVTGRFQNLSMERVDLGNPSRLCDESDKSSQPETIMESEQVFLPHDPTRVEDCSQPLDFKLNERHGCTTESEVELYSSGIADESRLVIQSQLHTQQLSDQVESFASLGLQDSSSGAAKGHVPHPEGPRPSTVTRASLEARFQEEKAAILGDLKRDLAQRLKLRKKSGIMSDGVFQQQIRSSFWTADMLYHRWGSDLLEMRTKWKAATGNFEDNEDDVREPDFPRERRLAFSNDRNEETNLLDFEALRSMAAAMNPALRRTKSTDTPSSGGSPTTSQVNFAKAHPVLKPAMTSGSLRSTPPLSRTGSRVDMRPLVLTLADYKPKEAEDGMADDETPEGRKSRLRALFVAIVMKVVRITRVAICMIRASKELNIDTFLAQLHFYNTRTMEEELTFEKEKYSRKYSKLHVPNWARKIGLKPPWERTPDDVMALYSILKNLKSFERFTHQMRMEICRAATYSCCEKGRVILRQGHVGHNFYFIFSGSVFVQIDIADAQTGVVTPETTCVMEKGSSFGELALLGTGRRTASIICRENTELFEIEKETFMELCPDMFEKELEEKIDTAKRQDIFSKFPASDLKLLCFHSFIEEVAYGQVIELDTANTDTIYFIIKGKITLLKEFDLSTIQPEDRVAIQTFGNKDLPTPRPGQECNNRGRQMLLPQATDTNKCFLRVGELRDGGCTEISILHPNSKIRSQAAGVTLVSNGVRLMRMSKRTFEQYAPRVVMEILWKQPVKPLRVPCQEELYRKYLGDVNWSGFKSKVVETLHEEKTGALIASKPSTSKGSTGWAKWPGSRSNAKRVKSGVRIVAIAK
ncbi:uncharacterized protein LOC117305396 [Asterias rubens]|uniref:uncharacterized protein LOC117305396 n=1 Tax=Asterias rubens TaxID=7604 RepID=UPI001455476E|nr:uncharacterized protein LOC117305396 [Asterias rubens]